MNIIPITEAATRHGVEVKRLRGAVYTENQLLPPITELHFDDGTHPKVSRQYWIRISQAQFLFSLTGRRIN